MVNKYTIEGDVAVVSTASGRTFSIWAFQIPLIQDYSWSFSGSGYVYGRVNKKMVLLSRYLTQAKDDEVVDHENHDRSDNRTKLADGRGNLRVTDTSHNNFHKQFPKRSPQGFVHVYYNKHINKWMAKVKVNSKTVNIYHAPHTDDGERACALAYNQWVIEHDLQNWLELNVVPDYTKGTEKGDVEEGC